MKKYAIRLSATVLFLLIPAIIGLLNPDIDHQPSICPFLHILHIPCPGCGLTKSIIHFYKGEWGASLHYHWWGGIFVLAAIGMTIFTLYDCWKMKSLTEKLLNNIRLWQTASILFVLTYIIRQITGI